MSKIEETIHQSSQVLQGKVAGGSHPIHPATVHFPIAFLTASLGLDALAMFPGLMSSLAAMSVLPPVNTLSMISHYSGALGIITAAPSIITGLGELYEMARAQAEGKGSVMKTIMDAYQKNDIAGEKLKTTITHASLNDLVVGVVAYNWWTRRKLPGLELPMFNKYLSAATIPIFLYSAYLGGSLVYEYGTGVQRQGKALEIKEKQG